MIKPSTIILLIISAVLIIAGVIMISTGNAMAKSKNINLFQAADEIDDQGRNFETHNLEDETEDVVIAIDTEKDTVINVKQTVEKSYVEIINFPKNQFEFTNSNQKMVLRKLGKISDYVSLASLQDNGFDSWGLRYFFKNHVDKEYPYTVNLYISQTSALKTVKLECGNGEINFEKIAVSAIEFDLKMKNGNVFLHNVTSPLKMNVSIDNGNLNLKNNNTGDLEASIKKGALIVNTNRQTNLVLKCTNGVVNTYFKGNTVEEHTTPESFTEIFPSYEQLGSAESGAIPQLIANIDMGDASIYYGYETEEEESEEETGESEEEKTGDEEDQAA